MGGWYQNFFSLATPKIKYKLPCFQVGKHPGLVCCSTSLTLLSCLCCLRGTFALLPLVWTTQFSCWSAFWVWMHPCLVWGTSSCNLLLGSDEHRHTPKEAEAIHQLLETFYYVYSWLLDVIMWLGWLTFTWGSIDLWRDCIDLENYVHSILRRCRRALGAWQSVFVAEFSFVFMFTYYSEVFLSLPRCFERS